MWIVAFNSLIFAIGVDHRVHYTNELTCVHFLGVKSDRMKGILVSRSLDRHDVIEALGFVLASSVLVLLVQLSCFCICSQHFFVDFAKN
jgi:hypothetical protein